MVSLLIVKHVSSRYDLLEFLIKGINPLVGKNLEEFGPRFPPVSSAYDFDARVIAAKTALELGLESSLREGVYSFVGMFF